MKADRGRSFAGIAVGGVCLALVLLIGLQVLWQRQEAEQLTHRIASVRSEVGALTTVAGREEELQASLAELRSKVAAVEGILPESLGLKLYRISYEGECASRGITVAGWKAREDKSQELQRGLITAELRGDLTRLPDLEARVRWLARLVDWREAGRAGDAATVELTVYALHRKPRDKPATSCEGPASSVWLWPFTSSLHPRREELQDACRQLAALTMVQAQADEYLELKTHLLAAVSAVEKLRPEGRSH